MAKFTFLEVHLDGAKFTANAPGGKIEDAEAEPEVSVGDVGDDEESSGKGKWVAALVGLLFLVAVAALAKKKLGGDADEAEIPELAGRE